jgi:glycosyltransferase involved in cell wall biosynthesis
VVFEPVNQIGRARNRGAEAATGDWLIFVDADSHPSRELFADTANAIESGKYLFGGAYVHMKGAAALVRVVTTGWNIFSRLVKYAAGAYIFCEAAAFRKIGGFDLRLYATEEIDLSQRLKALARATGKKAIILHRHPLLSSARKVQLYSPREIFLFTLRAAFFPRRTVRDQKACYAWYDGRR